MEPPPRDIASFLTMRISKTIFSSRGFGSLIEIPIELAGVLMKSAIYSIPPIRCEISAAK